MFKFLKSNDKRQFQKISYSQSGEDLIVQYIFDAIGIEKPSYLDIGAYHPYRFSNTALFYEKGSRGVNVEPDPVLFKKFPDDRPEDVNLNIGVGLERGEADFFIMSSPTLNTFSRQEAERYQRETQYKLKEVKKLKVDTYQNLVETYFKNAPDFLSLDVEGWDEVLIKNIDYSRSAPVVICVETITFSEKGKGVKQKGIIDFLQQAGYLYYADTNINSIFVLKTKWER
ncbi:MAG TPA: FkbM family methyltransferase [Chitinophagales bacterium]|nr:FkbM family methyltransferase [Chitinophagales bacterium]